jgi:hypothetical protein
LSAMISQYFIGGMMPELGDPVQQSVTVVEIRPFKGGWQCVEAPGVHRTGLVTMPSRVLLVMPKRGRNMGAEKFVC